MSEMAADKQPLFWEHSKVQEILCHPSPLLLPSHCLHNQNRDQMLPALICLLWIRAVTDDRNHSILSTKGKALRHRK